MPIAAFRRLFFCLLLIGSINRSSAQDTATVFIDTTSHIDVRMPAESVVDSFASLPTFQYEDPAQHPDSILKKFFFFLLEYLFRLLNHPIGGFLAKTIFVLTLVGFLFTLLNQMVGGELVGVLSNRKKDQGFSIALQEEELTHTNFEQLRQKAIAEKDFQAATRYSYLLVLQHLHAARLISWSIEKTNLDYQKELSGHPVSPDFNQLTTYYNFVEYGDFTIDEHTFNTVLDIYNSFMEKLTP